MKELIEIQRKLKAPKGQYNKFGGYAYRSCEDILEEVKPLLEERGCQLCMSDEMVQLGDRYYVRAKAIISDSEGTTVEVYAYARESETKKGMDAAQITGAASSYARKYALNGLFLIDDTKDQDATNDHWNGGGEPEKATKKPSVDIEKMRSPAGHKWIQGYESVKDAIEAVSRSYTLDDEAKSWIEEIWNKGQGTF